MNPDNIPTFMQPLIDEGNIAFDKPYLKVLGFIPFSTGEYAVMVKKDKYIEAVVIHENGKVKQKAMKDWNLTNFQAISFSELIWLDIEQYKIYQWDITKEEPLSIPHKFLDSNQATYRQLFLFPETKLVCLAEWGRKGQLTYYSLPLHQQTEPIMVYRPLQWSHQFFFQKGNNKSMVIWANYLQNQKVNFHTYQLNQKFSQYEQIIIHHTFNNESKTYFSINGIWEMNENVFFIAGVSENHTNKTADLYPTYLYVAEDKTKVLRETKVILDKKFGDQITQCFNLGNYGLLKTYHPTESNAPLYFISNKNEELVYEGKSDPKINHKFYIPPYDSNTIVIYECQNLNVSTLHYRRISLMAAKQIYCHLILSKQPQADQDLIQSIIDFLQ